MILGILLSANTFAQKKYQIKGSLTDTSNHVSLVNSSVSVLRAEDSTLVGFTRTDNQGIFTLSKLPPGKFLLLATYPGYADYMTKFSLDSTTSVNLNRISMSLKAKLLQDVIIKGKAAAIKIKGDTTEFNAASYTIQPNAKVEDLLKQLPGIQVDQDGKITAQGQTVTKVLVDGEEFFGDDPTLVTKNLRGDMVDKVQLYDKTSDQAAFTGIDDGKKTKTINIKLKDDKKNGYFGKLDAGLATDKYYEEQAMFNIFKGKKKFSAYGTLGNTGKTGLGWSDDSKYGSSENVEFGDGYIMIDDSGSDALSSFNGQYDGRGLPLARTGGVHYDNKWNNDKESVNTNYKAGSINVEGISNNLSQNNLPSGIIQTSSAEKFDNFMFRQKLDATYQVKLDSSSSLKVSADGTLRHSEANSDFNTISRRNDTLINSTTRSLRNNVDDKVFNAKILWEKKLRKKGRTISVNLSEALIHSESQGYLKSVNTFYQGTGVVDSTQQIDQFKASTTSNSAFNSNVAYTEPVSKRLSLIVNYGFGAVNSSADRKSFNETADGKYAALDPLYSNNYQFDQLINQGGVVLNYIRDKTTINIGTKVSGIGYTQNNHIDQTVFKRNFLNWNPRATYKYKFSQQRSLSINYEGSNQQPSINQIQPVAQNTDPLNIVLGNPGLDPSFTHRLTANYNSYKVLTSQSLFLGGSYAITSDPIVSMSQTDEAGKSTYQSVNLSGKRTSNFYFYLYAGRNINFFGLNTGFNLNTYANTYYSYVNNALNKTNAGSYSASLYLAHYQQKPVSFRISAGPAYNRAESSLQSALNNNGWAFNSSGSVGADLPLKFEISTDGNYEFRGKTKSFNTDFSRFIWNAAIAKKFTKSQGLKLSLRVNDLLDQNKGFNRSASETTISQSDYTTVRRYYSISLAWDFNKMGGSTAKSQTK